MLIKVYYEDKFHPTTVDIPDADCEIWIENDYRRRLEIAENKSAVMRRTAQEIMDEDYNKPTFNSHHKETRRHVSLEAFDPEGDTIAGEEDVEDDIINGDHTDLYRAIEQLLPQQRELIKKIFWEDIRQVEIAKTEGVNEAAVSARMARIYARLKKFLTDQKNFSKDR